jgi:two-component system, NarL family, invasion response regulator UvrY
VSIEDTRVLVVDDQEQFREAVRDVVAALPGFVIVAEAASGEEAMAAVGSSSPGLILMDVRLTGLSGIEATRAITNRNPHVVVILMSVDGAEGLWDTARLCGAAAVVRKQDLRPRTLREIWYTQRDARSANAASD